MMETSRSGWLLLLLMALASLPGTSGTGTCYAGRFNVSTSLPPCSGTERGYSLRNATFFCYGHPVHCEFEAPTVCEYVYVPVKLPSASPQPSPYPTGSPLPSPVPGSTSYNIPMLSPTPTCTANIRNLTNSYCRTDCCGDFPCEELLRDTSGLVVNLTDVQIVRHGLLNDKFSSYNYSLDGVGGEIYRPRCDCEIKGNFLNKAPSCISGIGTFPRARPFLKCTLCYPCYESTFEANLAASSSSSIRIETPDGPRFCPQRDGTDPVGCFAGEELDRICLDNYHSGLEVNGDELFCSENICNPRSLCNCSYVDFHEECRLGDGMKVFRAQLPVLQRDEIHPRSSVSGKQPVLPQVTFDGENLLVLAAEPYNLKLSYNGKHFSLKSQMSSSYSVRNMIPPGPFSVTHGGSGTTINFYLEPKTPENHRTLGTVMFSLSLILPVLLSLYGIYLCVPKTFACLKTVPLVMKMQSGGGKVLEQFLPTKMNFSDARAAVLFLGIGLVSCSLELTNDKLIIGSSYNSIILDDCRSIKQYTVEDFLVLDRPNVDCDLSLSHYNGSEIVFEESILLDSWVNCRVRSPILENLADTVSCSSTLSAALITLTILSLILLACVLGPSFIKICLIVIALSVPVRACDFSQSITSSSVNCLNTPSGQNCSLTGTFSAYLELSQTFCVGTKNSFGVPGTSLTLEYVNSTETLQTKTVGYTQGFEQKYFSRDRCNDCLISCNGDCSSDQCQTIGGFGVNPNNQNDDNSVLSCPSYSGCDLIQDDVAESWTSGCLLKPNCHWWQYISCGLGEVSPLSSIFSSRVSSGILLRSGNRTRLMRTTEKQPVAFEGFLISTSTQINPVDFKSLGYDTLVKKSGDAFLCRTQGFDESRRESLGDYFCVEPSCTYRGPESIRIPDNLCDHDTLGSNSVFSCHKSFYSELETQSTCRRLPFTTEAGLLYYQDSQLLLDLSQSSQVEVRVGTQNTSFQFTSDLIKPDLSVANCSGFVDFSGSSGCRLKGSCTPPGLVSLSTTSSSVILSQNSAYCSGGLDFKFSVFEEEVDFLLFVGNRVFNDSLRINFKAQNYTAVVQEDVPVLNVEDEGWEPLDSWDKILKGVGNVWDWIIIMLECLLVLAVLGVLLYLAVRIFLCLLPSILSALRRMKLKKIQREKDPEKQVVSQEDLSQVPVVRAVPREKGVRRVFF